MGSVLRRHPWVRWFAPAVVVALAALTATGVFTAGASTSHLPPTTPSALIASARTSHVTGYSGTVVTQFSLGLPALPDLGGGSGNDGASFAALLSGSHTLQVWYGGAQEQRVAVLGATDETDVFRDGRSLWLWDSSSRAATHAELPRRGAGASAAIANLAAPHAADPTALTPDRLARRALSAITPSTRVQVRRGASVADRSAYELILTPRSATTLIGSVHISIDGVTKVPLGVQIYPRGSSIPAVDVSYTSIDFGRPSRSSFRFDPPAGAKVRQVHVAAAMQRMLATAMQRGVLDSGRFATSGSDWSSVGCFRLDRHRLPRLSGPLGHALVPASGSWGNGRLFQSALFTALVTRDGWVCGGAVQPGALYAAATGR
jgi:outer membrane lipoprotein-sorting protein